MGAEYEGVSRTVPVPADGLSASRVLFLLGRSLLFLAGAFLLRSLTDRGVLPPALGFGLGNIVTLFTEFPVNIPLPWAVRGLLFCTTVGLTFGLWPAAKAAVDSFLLMGPTGSGAPHVGDFEGGQWHGWTSRDLTLPPANHWQASTYQAVNGAYSAWCGEASYLASERARDGAHTEAEM